MVFHLIAAACRYTGLLWLWRTWHRRAVIVLTVHGVGGPSSDQTWTPLRARMPPERLDKCLSILKGSYHFVSLADAVEMLSGRRTMQPGSIVLTFDDGYRNHITQALPVLEKHRVPAIVFVSTGPVVNRVPFWFDRLDYAIQHGVREPETITVAGASVALDPSSRHTLASSFTALRSAAKTLLRDDRAMNTELDALSHALEQRSGRRLADILEADPWSAVLTADDIRKAAARVAFGSHTVDHLRVNRLDRDTAAAQLTRSRRDLEAWTAKPCRFFCYPDGGVSGTAEALVREAGYEAAVTTERGLNYAGDDLMHLRRIDLSPAGSASELLLDVSGLKDWLLGFRRFSTSSADQRPAPSSDRSNAPAS